MKFSEIKNIINLDEVKLCANECKKECENYENKVKLVAKEIENSGKKIVLLAGPSGSGKTTTSRKIVEYLTFIGKNANYISLDNFFKNGEDTPTLPDGSKNYDSLSVMDLVLLGKVFKDISSCHDIRIPVYDFLAGRRVENAISIPYREDNILVFEGIHALNPALCEDIDSDDAYKIYVDINSDYYKNGKPFLSGREMRLCRRMVRDYYYRNASAALTFELWKNVVVGERENIIPYRHLADCYIDSAHNFEPMLFKELAMNIDKGPFGRSFEILPSMNADILPADSLMTEFLPSEN